MKTILSLLLLTPLLLPAQPVREPAAVREGNVHYRNGQFAEAERLYRAALQQAPASALARYNLGAALYQQKRYSEAAAVWGDGAKGEGQPGERAAAYYNQGVAFTKQKALQESIDAYKNALRLSPYDQQARENLIKALREQKQQQQQQQQQRSGMSEREAEQKLKALQEKERKAQQRLQNRARGGTGPGNKDW